MNTPASAGTLVLHTPAAAIYVFTLSVPHGAELYRMKDGKAVRLPLQRGDAQTTCIAHIGAGVDVFCRGIACSVAAAKLTDQPLAG